MKLQVMRWKQRIMKKLNIQAAAGEMALAVGEMKKLKPANLEISAYLGWRKCGWLYNRRNESL